MDRCLICHRKLKDDESKRRKIGPTCWKRVMKVAAEEKAKRRARREHKKEIKIPGQMNLFEEDADV